MLIKLTDLENDERNQEIRERIACDNPLCEKNCAADCLLHLYAEAEATVCYEV